MVKRLTLPPPQEIRKKRVEECTAERKTAGSTDRTAAETLGMIAVALHGKTQNQTSMDSIKHQHGMSGLTGDHASEMGPQGEK